MGKRVVVAAALATIASVPLACSSDYSASGDAPADAGTEASSSGDAGAPEAAPPDASVPRGTHVFSKSFGGPDEDYLTRANVDVSGNLLLGGSFADTIDFGTGPLTSKGALDIYFAKFSPAGAAVFANAYGDVSEQNGVNIVGTGSGDIYAAGVFTGTVSLATGDVTAPDSQFDGLILRLDSSGSLKESFVVGGPGKQVVPGIAYDGSRGVFYAGQNAGTAVTVATNGGNDVILGHALSTQNWAKGFGDASEQFASDVAYDPAGNIVTVGWFGGVVDLGTGAIGSAGGYDVFVARHAPSGAPVWSKSFGAAGDQQGSFVRVGAGGDIFVVGTFTGTMAIGTDLVSAGGVDLFLAKLASDGTIVWSKRFGGAADDLPGGLAIAPNGDILICGHTSGDLDLGLGALAPAGDADAFVARLDKDGKAIWAKRFGDAGFQTAQGVGVTLTDEVWIAGYYTGTIDLGGGAFTSAGKHDVYIARFTP